MTGFQRHDVFVTSHYHTPHGVVKAQKSKPSKKLAGGCWRTGADHVDLYLMDWPMAFDGTPFGGKFIDTGRLWKTSWTLAWPITLRGECEFVAAISDSQGLPNPPGSAASEIHPYLPEESSRGMRGQRVCRACSLVFGADNAQRSIQPRSSAFTRGHCRYGRKEVGKTRSNSGKLILQRSFGLVARVGSQMTTVDYVDLVGWRLTSEEMRRLSILKKFKWRSPVTNQPEDILTSHMQRKI